MTMKTERHVPVLLKESLEFLAVKPGDVYVDCTLGLGGHSAEILRRLGAGGKLICFDRDAEAMALAKPRLDAVLAEKGSEAPKLELVHEPFSEIAEHVKAGSVDGILADFGVSSLHLDEAARGFSFQADGPLDMRMDQSRGITAEQVVNQMDERELANLIYEYGDERRSRRFARAVVRARPVTTTGQLARIIAGSGSNDNKPGIHPATKTFQAIRIYVNRELEEIKALVEAAPGLLKVGGRAVLISFHSLEDRIVKDAFRDGARDGVWELLTKKPVVADEEETRRNPRSRSAKLRVAGKKAGTSR